MASSIQIPFHSEGHSNHGEVQYWETKYGEEWRGSGR
jgi:hypothetical protein